MITQELGILVHLSRSITFHYKSDSFINLDRGNMAKALIGILLDVSDSMRDNVGSGVDEDGGPWALSIFEVIDNLIKHDVSPDNSVFALAFGARGGDQLLDILTCLQSSKCDQKATDDQIEKIYRILEGAGAKYIRKWARREVVQQVLTHQKACLVLEIADFEKDFPREFVQKCLPLQCRDYPRETSEAKLFSPLLTVAEHVYASVGSAVREATEEDIQETLRKARPLLLKFRPLIFNVKKASDILHGHINDERELTKKRSRELLEKVEPYIYGATPLYQAIRTATKCFEKHASTFQSHKKLLFVLSDGDPTDGGENDSAAIKKVATRLENAGVTVVGCFVTQSKTIQPRQMFSKMNTNWDSGSKFLFSLSSTITTQSIPRTMFVKRKWSIDFENNETRLFLQVNHPDHLREACDLARKVVCSQEALSTLLADVDLDVYINQSVRDYEAQEKQEGHTCYAHASATVLHLTMKRIHGRRGKIPTFDELKDEMIGHFGKEASSITTALKKMCRKYHLRYKSVDLKGAMEAVASSRPVVATFKLTRKEWDRFKEFFITNGKGILTKKEIDITARPSNPKRFGHAVVLTSFNSEYLRLLDSRGSDWADNGFIKVQNADVLGFKFYDVYWEIEDLNEKEKTSFKELGSKRAKWLMETLPSLQRDDYTVKCPICRVDSPVKDFTGNLLQAKCPKCKKAFVLKDVSEGNILALNIYLTSLGT